MCCTIYNKAAGVYIHSVAMGEFPKLADVATFAKL